jgi:CRP-like cAMP-binding protein
MNCDMFGRVREYAALSDASEASWRRLLRTESYRRGEQFIALGEVPTRVGFVVDGLFSQNYISETGADTIKYFFPKGRFAASAGAMLTKSPSTFSVIALEDSEVLSYDFAEFRKLTKVHSDIAAFYMRYMELHWIIEKEPLEISFRYDTALTRYQSFMEANPGLSLRLKKHQIASYLGITPTQLSRVLLSTK